jgi:hypothetical protein
MEAIGHHGWHVESIIIVEVHSGFALCEFRSFKAPRITLADKYQAPIQVINRLPGIIRPRQVNQAGTHAEQRE